MALTRIVIETPLTATQDRANMNLNGTGSWHNIKRLLYWMEGFVNGSRRGNMLVKVGAVKASCTVTFTSTGPANNQTMIVNGYVVYAKTTVDDPAIQFERSNTPSIAATRLAALLNTSAYLSPYMSAVASSGVVTVSCTVPGVIGNSVSFGNYDMDNTAITGGGRLINGSDGTATNLTLGQVIA